MMHKSHFKLAFVSCLENNPLPLPFLIFVLWKRWLLIPPRANAKKFPWKQTVVTFFVNRSCIKLKIWITQLDFTFTIHLNFVHFLIWHIFKMWMPKWFVQIWVLSISYIAICTRNFSLHKRGTKTKKPTSYFKGFERYFLCTYASANTLRITFLWSPNLHCLFIPDDHNYWILWSIEQLLKKSCLSQIF